MTAGPYRRPHFQGSIEDPPRDAVGNDSLSGMLGRVSENSMSNIDNLAGEFQRLREKLRSDGERIQREIDEYTALSKQVTQLTQVIYESMGKIRASVTH
jgi:chemotaxis protein histidine kinase CheA